MNSLDEYISYITDVIKNKNITDELCTLKYIYLDLGKRFSFDVKFFPFGSTKYKTNLYKYHSRSKVDLDDCFKNDIVICRSMAYILYHVCRNFDIDIKTLTDLSNEPSYGIKQSSTKYPHVYNEVTLKDGRTFIIDLQDDMRNIKSHSFTHSFGTKNLHGNEYVINRKEQENIDRKIGYISDDNYYFDDYLYLLHYHIDTIEDFDEKVDFLLENIDYTSRENMGFTDRQWLHKTIIEEFFDISEFNYDEDTGRIIFVNCFKHDKNSGDYLSLITINGNNGLRIFIYNEEEYKYKEITLEEVADLFIGGYTSHKIKIPGIDRYVRKRKEENNI